MFLYKNIDLIDKNLIKRWWRLNIGKDSGRKQGLCLSANSPSILAQLYGTQAEDSSISVSPITSFKVRDVAFKTN